MQINKIVNIIIAALMFFVFFVAIDKDINRLSEREFSVVGVGDIAKSIFRDYVFPFELISFLLLSSLMGAIYLAKKDRRTE